MFSSCPIVCENVSPFSSKLAQGVERSLLHYYSSGFLFYFSTLLYIYKRIKRRNEEKRQRKYCLSLLGRSNSFGADMSSTLLNPGDTCGIMA